MGIVDRILGRQPETRGKAGFWSQDTSNEVAGTSITQATSLQIGVCRHQTLRRHGSQPSSWGLHPSQWCTPASEASSLLGFAVDQ